jgi:hypothetical protein
MFLRLRRVLPEGKEIDVTVNTDQIVWAQPDSAGNTISIVPVNGPELVVKRSKATDDLLSGTISRKIGDEP